MFETEHKHRRLVDGFTAATLDLAVARQRTENLDRLAEHDETRAAEYRALADQWASKAEALHGDVPKANAAIAAHVGGG